MYDYVDNSTNLRKLQSTDCQMHRKSSSRTKFDGKLLFAYGGKQNVGGKNFIDLISMVILHDAIEQKNKSVKQGPKN